MAITLFTKCVFEFIGTLILVLLGDGVCAACTLEKSKAKGAGWVVITLAWGFAVMCGVFVAGPYSGAHLNPAVTLGLAVAGGFAWNAVLPYMAAQMLGGFAGALLVYVFYYDHYNASSQNPDGMLGTFCTMPAIEHKSINFISELIATFCPGILHFSARNVREHCLFQRKSCDDRRPRSFPCNCSHHGSRNVSGRHYRICNESRT